MTAVPDIGIHVLDSPEEVSEFWDWLTRPRDFIACDTETTGLDTFAFDFKVRMLQFGTPGDGWAIDFQAWRMVSRAALEWLQQHRVTIVFHNALYDWLALHREGIDLDWSLIGDTMIVNALMGYADESRALKDIASVRYGNWASAGQSVLHRGMSNRGWTWATVPFGWKPYPLYGVVDTVVTAMYWEEMRPYAPLWSADHGLEMAVCKVVAQSMMIPGVAIDGAYLHEHIAALAEEENEINARLLQYGITSAANGNEIARALSSVGVQLTVKTSQGRLSTAKDVLKEISHPIAADVLKVRYVSRMRTNYLVKLLESAGGLGEVGITHPDIKPMEAKTGRMSISNPPMQQLPKENPMARNAIVPRRPGEVLVSADYSQIEMRMFAKLTRDEKLCATFRDADATRGDFFVQIGRDVYHDPTFVKADPRRQMMKATMYGAIYTAGVPTMAASAGVSEDEMETTVRVLQARYPSLKTLGSELVTQRMDAGKPVYVVKTPFGREIRVRKMDEARKLINYLVQGTSAIVLKRAMVHAEASGLGPYMVLPVHDELLLSVPKEDAEEAQHQLLESMRWGATVPGFEDDGVTIPAEAGNIVERWGDAK